MLKLTKFEIGDNCKLPQEQIERLKGILDFKIETANKYLSQGHKRFDWLVEKYQNEIEGIKTACAYIGILVHTKYIEN